MMDITHVCGCVCVSTRSMLLIACAGRRFVGGTIYARLIVVICENQYSAQAYYMSIHIPAVSAI